LLGRLGSDPEIRRVGADQKAVCDVTIATNNGGDRPPDWHKVTLWEQSAEMMATQRKGSLVYIEGSLKTDKWTNKEGVDQYKTFVRAYRFEFCEPKRSSAPSQSRDSISGDYRGDDDIRF
jgi:single-strand DNA-binding protein